MCWFIGIYVYIYIFKSILKYVCVCVGVCACVCVYCNTWYVKGTLIRSREAVFLSDVIFALLCYLCCIAICVMLFVLLCYLIFALIYCNHVVMVFLSPYYSCCHII